MPHKNRIFFKNNETFASIDVIPLQNSKYYIYKNAFSVSVFDEHVKSVKEIKNNSSFIQSLYE